MWCFIWKVFKYKLCVPAVCSVENPGGTDGEPQRGSSETAESPQRRDRAQAEKRRPTQRVGYWLLIVITDHRTGLFAAVLCGFGFLLFISKMCVWQC